MPCPEPQAWFELADPARRDPLERHLDTCDDCRALVAGMARAGVVDAGRPRAGTEPGARGRAARGVVPELAARGERIDRYVVHGPIGAGAMGIVLAAYDPRLERTVALKLVRGLDRSPAAIERARGRLIGEAKAMARLAHPNVVAVHEVVEADGELVIAMERVDGADLATWLAEAPRTRAERLRVLVDAGRGIVAAHAAGLIHRDIKPANILIGRDGRARVTDLGLAAAIAADVQPPDTAGQESAGQESAVRESAVRESDVRESAVRESAGRESAGRESAVRMADGSPDRASGRVLASRLVGTPGYLAPEVMAGVQGDARSDQYAFAVTAVETLSGARPGRGRPDRSRIGRVLARALAARPEDRHPSMAALVDRLDRAARPRWPRFAVAALVVVAAGLAAAWWYERGRPMAVARCDDDPTVGATWTPARRAELATLLAGHDESPGHQLSARALEVVDGRAAAWGAAVAEVCTARSRGTQSPEVADRRGACLEDQRRQLDAVVVAISDRTSAARALSAVGALPLAESCAVPPEVVVADGPDQRRVRDELRAIAALSAAGRYEDAGVRMTALVPTVPAADTPLLALVTFRRADLTRRQGDAEGALALIQEALALAEQAHDDATRVDVMTNMVVILDELGRTTEARALVPLLEAAAARQTLDPHDTSRLEHALGSVAYTSGAYAEAERHYRAALAVDERSYGARAAPQVAGVLEALGTALHAQAKTEEARAVLTRSLEMFNATVGPKHPDSVLPVIELAALAYEADDFERSAELYQRAIDTWTEALGPEHPYLCEPMEHLGRVEWALEHDDRALELQRRALAIADKGFGPGHPLAAVAQIRIAEILEHRGDHAGAKAMAAASVATWDATGTVIPDAHDARFMLAKLLWRDGARGRARQLAEVARAGYADLAPPYNKTATTIAVWLDHHPAGSR